MQTLFSTRGVPPHKSFNLWRDVLRKQFGPSELTPLGERPFQGTIAATAVGELPIAHVIVDAIKTEVTSSTIRRHHKGDMICVMVCLEGSCVGEQYGREDIQNIGDIVLWDTNEPAVMAARNATSIFLINVPRRRLEETLGPARLFSSLTLDGKLGGASLATTFFKGIVDQQNVLDPTTASRMSSIGLDLLSAAIAQQLARDPPRSIQGDVLVQRAKAFAMTNLGDPDLGPGKIAAVLGISLRRLQELFQERGRYVADWIWEKRLEKAHNMLADPSCYHIAIGMIAYNCGFINQAHFSTRFKRRYELTPREIKVKIMQDPATARIIRAVANGRAQR